MAAGIRVVIFNADEAYGPELRAGLLSFDGVRIVAEVDDPILLPQAAAQFPADVAIIHLDPAPEPVLMVARQVAAELPNLPLFALSQSTDGQLILSAMRSGIREFITKPIDREILASAFEKIARKRLESAGQGRLIAVLGAAGGVGATSVATNLAVELADIAGGRVALVDLDFRFGQVATMLDLDTTYTIADLCESPGQIESQLIERALVKHGSGLRVLGRPKTFTQAENISAAHCVGVLTGLATLHEFVVVDGPTRFDMGAKAVLDVADEILLVMHLLVPCVRNVSRMLEGMRQVGFNLERVKLICNRTCRDVGAVSLDDVRETLGIRVEAALPDDWATMSAAVNLGEPLALYAPKSRIRTALRELAERLHHPEHRADEQDAGKKGGIFSKIFSDA